MATTMNSEVKTAKTLKAPVELVWEAWTNPEFIMQWWGPEGFTCTIHKMDLKKGGEWLLTLHGPDGTNYPNRSVFTEIVPFKKIVFEHFNPHFLGIVLFESVEKETKLDWTMRFDSEEMRDTVVKAHNAGEGQKQNVQRLERYLASVKSR
jgi:uncharacterized protein YndB with AHSA1/START domain